MYHIITLNHGIIYACGCTSIGMKRKVNEDYYLINNDTCLFIVADGMGGHQKGDIASQKVAIELKEHILSSINNNSYEQKYKYSETVYSNQYSIDDTDLAFHTGNLLMDRRFIQHAVKKVNSSLYNENFLNGYSEANGMGSTLVGLIVDKIYPNLTVFHVGDSRAYLFRDHNLQLLTRDHTLANNLKNNTKISKNVLLKAIGPKNNVGPDISYHTIKNNDVFILCSDGLTGMLSDVILKSFLNNIDINNIEEVCTELVSYANQLGGNDNITLIIGFYNH